MQRMTAMAAKYRRGVAMEQPAAQQRAPRNTSSQGDACQLPYCFVQRSDVISQPKSCMSTLYLQSLVSVESLQLNLRAARDLRKLTKACL